MLSAAQAFQASLNQTWQYEVNSVEIWCLLPKELHITYHRLLHICPVVLKIRKKNSTIWFKRVDNEIFLLNIINTHLWKIFLALKMCVGGKITIQAIGNLEICKSSRIKIHRYSFSYDWSFILLQKIWEEIKTLKCGFIQQRLSIKVKSTSKLQDNKKLLYPFLSDSAEKLFWDAPRFCFAEWNVSAKMDNELGKSYLQMINFVK